MESNKTWESLEDLYLDSAFFLFNINDLPKIINDKDNNIKYKLILFANDTSLIITNPNLTDFIKDIYTTIKNMNVWFKTNLLSLTLDKTNFTHFITKSSSHIDGNVGCDNKFISNIPTLKFLELIIDDILTWKSHIELIVP
jgi:hypothetical protein